MEKTEPEVKTVTFQELMDCWDSGPHNSNRYVYDKILDQAKKKNLIPMIGAGLSAWVGYPQWKPLLLEHAAEFGVAEAVEAHLNAWRYEEAAQEIVDHAHASAWQDILRESFDSKQIRDRLPLRPGYQSLLPRLFPGKMLTTNFDHCLEWLYTDWNKILPDSDFNSLREHHASFFDEHILIKLHGDIDNIPGLVLTKSSYDQHYGRGCYRCRREA